MKKVVTIRTEDYQDWADAVNPENNETIMYSKDRDGKTRIMVNVKDFKEYLFRVRRNLVETRAHMSLKYGYDW